MTLWPRTLLWRSVLMIALLLALAHLAWLQIFQFSERGPRAIQIARQIVSVVNLTRAALISAEPSRRIELLRDLSQEEQVQVYLSEPGEKISPTCATRPGPGPAPCCSTKLITAPCAARLR